jgi:hypothetical protein
MFASALVAASIVPAAANPGASLRLQRVPSRAPIPSRDRSHLTDESPVPVWALGLMAAIGAAVALVVVLDPGESGGDTPDSN